MTDDDHDTQDDYESRRAMHDELTDLASATALYVEARRERDAACAAGESAMTSREWVRALADLAQRERAPVEGMYVITASPSGRLAAHWWVRVEGGPIGIAASPDLALARAREKLARAGEATSPWGA